MKRIVGSILLLGAVLCSSLQGREFAQRYLPGDEIHFVVERNGEVIGTQKATFSGWRLEGNDSLLHFELESMTQLGHAGRTVELEITSEVDFYPDGRPLHYQYEIDALGRKVKHQGAFSEFGYSGSTDRFGVEFPVSQPSRRWPLLLDSHFGLQWEIATGAFRLAPGDSAYYSAMIPQADTLVQLTVKALPRQQVVYGGDTLVVQPFQADPINQVLYVDGEGRLLRAYDAAQRTTVRRLAEGEESGFKGEPFFSSLYDRIPGYLLLFVFAAFWYVILSRRESLRPRTMLMWLLGALVGWPLLLYLMPEMAIQYERMLASPDTPALGTLLTVAGLAVLFAILEEGAKLLLLWLRQHFGSKLRLAAAVALGAAVGAGFAFLQAAYLTNFGADGSFMQPTELWQRFFTIGLNTLTGAMLGLFLHSRRTLWYYLLPLGLKALNGWLFVFVQRGSMKMELYYFFTGVICLVAGGLLIWLYLRTGSGQSQRQRKRRG